MEIKIGEERSGFNGNINIFNEFCDLFYFVENVYEVGFELKSFNFS